MPWLIRRPVVAAVLMFLVLVGGIGLALLGGEGRAAPVALIALMLAAGLALALHRLLHRRDRDLNESRRRFKDVTEIASDWVWEMGPDLRFIYLSDRFRDLTGIEPAAVIGKTRTEAAGEEQVSTDPAKWSQHLEDLEKRLPFTDFTYSLAARSGRRIHVRLAGKPVFAADGSFRGYVGVGTDVTAEVEATRQAEEARNRLLDAIESSGEGFALFDAHDRLVVCNRRFAETCDTAAPGAPFSDILKSAVMAGVFRTPDDRQSFLQDRLRRHANPPSSCEQEMADGRWLQIDEHRTRDGGTALFVTDVSALKQKDLAEQERQMARQSALLRATLDNIPLGVIVFDKNLRMVAANERLFQLLDFPRGWMGRSDIAFVDMARLNAERGDLGPGEVEDLVRRQVDLIRRSEPYTGERLRSDGTILEFHSHPMPDGGVVRVFADITRRKQAEESLRKSEEHLQAILEASPIGVAVSAPRSGNILFANARFAELNGMHPSKLLGRTVKEFYARPEQREELVTRLWAEGIVSDAEVRLKRPDGGTYWALLTLRLTSFGGEPAVLAWVYDISERKRAEEQLRMASLVLETANEAIMIFNADNVIEYANPAFAGYTGWTAAEVLGSKPGFLKSGRHDKEFYRRIRQTLAERGRWQGEMWNRHRDGKFIAAWVSLAAIKDEEGRMTHMVSVSQDITTRKEDEERIWRQANFDVLTGLPNRSLFMDRLDQAVKQGNRERQLFALMFLDLDGFKAVNDTLGHAAGDLLLQETARRLEDCVRSTDTVARLAGDEFTVILMDIKADEHAARIARNILKSLTDPFLLDGREAKVRASIGISVYPRDGEDADSLLEYADRTMYAVKRAGKNGFRFYMPDEPEPPDDA
ncbi:MAG: PAS domain S-box protein [Magnetospirillum sp. WYHS-4]